MSGSYAELTTQDPNPVKRWIQDRRLADALRFLRSVDIPQGVSVLDYGCGNGELLRRLAAQVRSFQAWAYEPAAHLMEEARKNLEASGAVTLVSSTNSIQPDSFDVVFCLEVFEHLPPNEIASVCEEIRRLVRPGGIVVIGVPHEIFLPALAKGVFRMLRRYGAFDASPRNVLAAAVGRPPRQRPSYMTRAGFEFHREHLGFDYRVFSRMLREYFVLERTWYSPFASLRSAFNFEVYFLARKR